MSLSRDPVVEKVREKYGAVAASTLSSETSGVRAVAEAFGYTPDELASLPAEANMGLSCGNPTATANLRPGEVVVDLGSGGGIDVLLAARKVGPTGKAIGIDMTPEMIERANRNAAKLRERGEALNVEFHLAGLESLPLPDNSVDVLISNCVINLAPDKPAVFREMFRVLKPGGRVAVSDIALRKELPDELARSVEAYVGCIAGAVPIRDYVRLLNEAGFDGVQVIDAKKDLNAYGKVEGQSGCCTPSTAGQPGCCAPAVAEPAVACCTPQQGSTGGSCCGSEPEPDLHASLGEILRKYDVNEYAASVQVFALKPWA